MTDAEREMLRREATLAVLAMAAATVIVLSGGRGIYVIAAIAVACVAWRIGFEDGARMLRRRTAGGKRKAAELLAAGAWQPIETAPKDGTWVLAVGKNGAGRWTTPQTVRWTGLWESPVHDARVEVYHQPTHWMPLPPAPAPQQGGSDGGA